MTAVCQHYGVSRKTFYKWRHHFQEGEEEFHVLKDRSRRNLGDTPRPLAPRPSSR